MPAPGQTSLRRHSLAIACQPIVFRAPPSASPARRIRLHRADDRACGITIRGERVASRGRRAPGPGGPSLPCMDALIKLEEVTKPYGSDAAPAAGGVSLRIAPGESVAVTGPSGTAKSALLNMIAGLDRPTSGIVIVAGEQIDRADRWRDRCPGERDRALVGGAGQGPRQGHRASGQLPDRLPPRRASAPRPGRAGHRGGSRAAPREMGGPRPRGVLPAGGTTGTARTGRQEADHRSRRTRRAPRDTKRWTARAPVQ